MLGQSWAEASERMIERTPPPERIAGIRRRHPAGQQKLFDTAEQPAIPEESPAPGAEGPVETVGERR
jgi:hypothetical protein